MEALMAGMGKLYDQGYRVTTADKAHLESSDGTISTVMRWQELARVWIGHWLSRPFHHLFNLIPGGDRFIGNSRDPASAHPRAAGRTTRRPFERSTSGPLSPPAPRPDSSGGGPEA